MNKQKVVYRMIGLFLVVLGLLYLVLLGREDATAGVVLISLGVLRIVYGGD